MASILRYNHQEDTISIQNNLLTHGMIRADRFWYRRLLVRHWREDYNSVDETLGGRRTLLSLRCLGQWTALPHDRLDELHMEIWMNYKDIKNTLRWEHICLILYRFPALETITLVRGMRKQWIDGPRTNPVGPTGCSPNAGHSIVYISLMLSPWRFTEDMPCAWATPVIVIVGKVVSCSSFLAYMTPPPLFTRRPAWASTSTERTSQFPTQHRDIRRPGFNRVTRLTTAYSVERSMTSHLVSWSSYRAYHQLWPLHHLPHSSCPTSAQYSFNVSSSICFSLKVPQQHHFNHRKACSFAPQKHYTQSIFVHSFLTKGICLHLPVSKQPFHHGSHLRPHQPSALLPPKLHNLAPRPRPKAC